VKKVLFKFLRVKKKKERKEIKDYAFRRYKSFRVRKEIV
jgi:hypothetical protein